MLLAWMPWNRYELAPFCQASLYLTITPDLTLWTGIREESTPTGINKVELYTTLRYISLHFPFWMQEHPTIQGYCLLSLSCLAFNLSVKKPSCLCWATASLLLLSSPSLCIHEIDCWRHGNMLWDWTMATNLVKEPFLKGGFDKPAIAEKFYFPPTWNKVTSGIETLLPTLM